MNNTAGDVSGQAQPRALGSSTKTADGICQGARVFLGTYSGECYVPARKHGPRPEDPVQGDSSLQTMQRDRAEKDTLIFRHVEERQTLHRQRALARQDYAKQVETLHQDIAAYMKMAGRSRLT